MLDYSGYNFKIERSFYDNCEYLFFPHFMFSKLYSFTGIVDCIDFVLMWDELCLEDCIGLTKLKNELVSYESRY